MTKEETSKLSELGERMVRLEVMIEALTEANKANVEQRKALSKEVKDLTAALNQGRGAKWALFALAGASATLGALMTNLIPHFTK